MGCGSVDFLWVRRFKLLIFTSIDILYIIHMRSHVYVCVWVHLFVSVVCMCARVYVFCCCLGWGIYLCMCLLNHVSETYFYYMCLN